MNNKNIIHVILFLLFFIVHSSAQPFIKGADNSFIPQIEANGGIFKDSGHVKDVLQIFHDHGFNYIRLRIWHTPTNNANNLAQTLGIATRIKQHGMKFLLNFHYSDWWADPSQQNKPAAWSSLNFATLKESVYIYSKNVITALKNQNTIPDMVQIGNEIVCGMLWGDGNVCGANDNSTQWGKLGQLLKEGIRGVKEGISETDSIRIMIHIDRGGDNGACQWFYNNIIAQGVPFDIIGLSYYPWWHGSLTLLSTNLNDLAIRYNKDIIIVETAYPWTLQWTDAEGNLVGDSSQVLSGYPATVAGQKAFLNELISTIKAVPHNRGKGVFYWEPDWITSPTFTSAYENLALFDFQGNALESFDAFSTSTFEQNIHAKWNLLSYPGLSFETPSSVIYPTSISSAYRFNNDTYTAQNTISSGYGYWVKFSSNQSIKVMGDSLLTDTITVQAGWNLIGSLSVNVPLANIVQIPSENIISGVYEFDGDAYNVVETLMPGRGYWVKVQQNGKIVLR